MAFVEAQLSGVGKAVQSSRAILARGSVTGEGNQEN
jgi:hypothetical protein